MSKEMNRIEKLGDLVVAILDVVRKAKSDRKVSLKTPITKLVIYANENLVNQLKQFEIDLANATNTLVIEYSNNPNAESVAINDELNVQIIW